MRTCSWIRGLFFITAAWLSSVALTAPAQPLAILTFNIRYANPGDGDNAWPNRREQVFAILRGESRPDRPELPAEPFDFVGLQEALRPQIDDILAATPGLYGEIGVGRDDGQSKGEHSSILYRKDRWTCARSGTFWLSVTPEVPGSKSWGNNITRICTWGEFRPVSASATPKGDAGRQPPSPADTIYIFNTHLDHQSQPSRQLSAALIAEKITAIAGQFPVILTGDFNAGEDNPVITYLTGEAPSPFGDPGQTKGDGETKPPATPPPPSHLADTFRALHPDEKTVGTFNSFDAKKTGGDKIDFVLFSPHWKVERAWIDRRTKDNRAPSDHWPLGAVVRLTSE